MNTDNAYCMVLIVTPQHMAREDTAWMHDIAIHDFVLAYWRNLLTPIKRARIQNEPGEIRKLVLPARVRHTAAWATRKWDSILASFIL